VKAASVAAGARAAWEATTIGVNPRIQEKEREREKEGIVAYGVEYGGCERAKRGPLFYFLHQEDLSVAVNCRLAANRTQMLAREDEENNV
jgi:hypothetical protein